MDETTIDEIRAQNRMKEILNDTASHDELKQIAKKILLNRGYKEDQIFSEYELILPDHNYRYVVDVVAFKDTGNVNKSKFRTRACGTEIPDVMIECGDTIYDKIVELRFIGKEVLWLPYGALPPELFVVDRLEHEIELLRREIEYLRKREKELEKLLENQKRTSY